MNRRTRRWIAATLLAVTLLLTFTAFAGEGTAQGLPVQFSGVVEALNATTMIVNGQVVDITNIQLGTPLQAGMTVAVTGTRTADGRIVATSLAILTTGVVTATPTTIPIASATPSRLYECALPANAWSDDEGDWPAQTLMLGTQSYTRDDLENLLESESGGDASVVLAQQLAAAKLNIANGADAQPAGNVIIQADTMLSRFEGRVPYNLHPSSPVGQAMMTHAQVLSSYNSNLLTPNCVRTDADSGDDEPQVDIGDEQRVIIEGPVELLNGNIVRIYNIDVILDPDDPVLDDLDNGTVIRVEGFLDIDEEDDDDDRTNFVLIAVDTEVTDINIWDRDRDGDVDDADFENNSCDNPPPEWATARGWRARCEGGSRRGQGRGGRGNEGSGGDQGSGDQGS